MIWFDAALEQTVDAETLRRGLAAVLDLAYDSVRVVYDLAAMGNADATVTCLVGARAGGTFSQILSIYTEPLPTRLGIAEAASSLAKRLHTRILLANDESVDPYSFVLVSETGVTTLVDVDRDALDRNDYYVLATP